MTKIGHAPVSGGIVSGRRRTGMLQLLEEDSPAKGKTGKTLLL
jgi:hypothetical protein